MSEHSGRSPTVFPRLRKVGGAELSHLIGSSHLSWHFDDDSTRALEAAVAIRPLGPLRLAWLRTNRWGGYRDAADIGRNPEPYLTVLMPLRGAISLTGDGGSVAVGKHELGIWDSSAPIEFDIDCAEFEQLSVLVPQRLLRADRRACRNVHCARVERTNVLSELCVRHMATLAKYLDDEMHPHEVPLTHVTASLFDAVIATLQRSSANRASLLAEIKEYIECYISEDTLSAATIAIAFNVSARYVHKLFEPEGMTVREWITARRVERSADDLRSGADRVTDIALRWGFKDLAHYSRVFRQTHGVSPREFRRAAH